jgi:predicted MFS family arabinose efflux permease
MRANQPAPSKRTLRALDAVNFLMADVHTGVGPFVAIYLAASLHWDPKDIGVALSAAGIAGLVAQTPVGAFVDVLRYKREALAVGTALLGIGALAIVFFHSFAEILAAQITMGVVGTFFPPAMAGMTLGIVGRRGLDLRIGRNETFNHAGNVFAAVAAGLLGYWIARRYIFYSTAVFCAVTIVAIFFIRRKDIDFQRSRGYESGEGAKKTDRAVSSFLEVLTNRSLLIFTISVVLFHFANAAMLPLIGEKLSRGRPRGSSLYMAVCIVGAQTVMIPVAFAAGRFAHSWGRKAVFLVGFAALPIRGALYTLTDNPYFLVGVQLMDGIGAAIFGVVSVLVIADLTRGTGRFNFTQGVVATATGLGASLSNGITGFIVQRAGFNSAFLFLAAVATFALGIFWIFMPETKKTGNSGNADASAPAPQVA